MDNFLKFRFHMTNRSLGFLILLFVCSNSASAGAWGYKSFENDDALDWVSNELERGRYRAIEKAITAAANGAGYLEAPDACYAIAACEVLAAQQGRPSSDVPENVAEIAKKLPRDVPAPLRAKARKALDRILGGESELKQLWEEAQDDFAKWKACVEELKSRV